MLAEQHIPAGLNVELSDDPPVTPLPELPRGEQGLFRIGVNFGGLGDPKLRWSELRLYGGFMAGHVLYAFHMPQGGWLNVAADTGADPALAFADLPGRVPVDDPDGRQA